MHAHARTHTHTREMHTFKKIQASFLGARVDVCVCVLSKVCLPVCITLSYTHGQMHSYTPALILSHAQYTHMHTPIHFHTHTHTHVCVWVCCACVNMHVHADTRYYLYAAGSMGRVQTGIRWSWHQSSCLHHLTSLASAGTPHNCHEIYVRFVLGVPTK